MIKQSVRQILSLLDSASAVVCGSVRRERRGLGRAKRDRELNELATKRAT